MKVIVDSKKGFTFMEIIITLAILSLVMLMIVPSVIKTYKDSQTNMMKIQEKKVADAAKLYIEDTCLNPIGTSNCLLEYDIDDDQVRTYHGIINIEVFISEGYIEEIKSKQTHCEGYVTVENTTKVKAYISCGTDYITEGY